MTVPGQTETCSTSDRDDELAARVQTLFGPGVAAAVTDPRQALPQLHPAERDAMTRMAPARQRSYAAGRAAARAAMRALGVEPAPVLMAADRSPLWPPGVMGSISHCDTCCIAVVADGNRTAGLGVDVETDDPLDRGLVPSICTPAERSRLDEMPPDQAGKQAKLIFSAKECTYKCQYPRSRCVIGFDAVEISFDPGTSGFCASFLQDVPGFARGTGLAGRYLRGNGLIVTAMSLPARS